MKIEQKSIVGIPEISHSVINALATKAKSKLTVMETGEHWMDLATSMCCGGSVDATVKKCALYWKRRSRIKAPRRLWEFSPLGRPCGRIPSP